MTGADREKPSRPGMLRSRGTAFIGLYRTTKALEARNAELERRLAECRQAQDVSERNNRELKRERLRLVVSERMARDKAAHHSTVKDEFLATLSHELRTPMNAILGWLSLLAKGDVVRDPRQAIAALQRNATIQARLIDNLLDVNRLMAGMVTLNRAAVILDAVAGDAVGALQPIADAKGVRLCLTPSTSRPAIYADEQRVQQILWNLLDNAVKFTPTNGRVDVMLETESDMARIVVRDTGYGIAADHLPFVFERFWRADSSTTRETSGLGLGLSIAKDMAELHGGSIEVMSDGLGAGATFVVRLPVPEPATWVGMNEE